jgi:hypothetical protein
MVIQAGQQKKLPEFRQLLMEAKASKQLLVLVGVVNFVGFVIDSNRVGASGALVSVRCLFVVGLHFGAAVAHGAASSENQKRSSQCEFNSFHGRTSLVLLNREPVFRPGRAESCSFIEHTTYQTVAYFQGLLV